MQKNSNTQSCYPGFVTKTPTSSNVLTVRHYESKCPSVPLEMSFLLVFFFTMRFSKHFFFYSQLVERCFITPLDIENFKSCLRVPKLRIWLLRGWGRCLKVTLQTCAPENFCSCLWGDEQTVKHAQTVSDMSGNFPAHVSAESTSTISPNPSEVISKVSQP